MKNEDLVSLIVWVEVELVNVDLNGHGADQITLKMLRHLDRLCCFYLC